VVAERAEPTKTVQGNAGGSGASMLALGEQLRDRVMALPSTKRNWLIGVAAFLVAVCAAMVWYAQRPDWRTLFNGLDGKDVQQVSQELAAAGIPYQVTQDGGGIEVPGDSLDKARMEVAAKGMPQTGRLGFELFDKPNWVGSEFDERVNYQRALEGELEHTINTLAFVRSSRVHLVLPQQSLFTSEAKMAKASVVLRLRRTIVDPAEADSIRSLVAGAVENLSPDDVTVVDADGRANLKPRSGSAAADDMEQALEAKVVSLLEPLAGRDNVRATVSLNFDEGSEERTDEIYDPTQVATASMQRTEQTTNQGGRPGGVPGTASNTPAASAQGAVQGSAAAAAPGTPPLLQKDASPVYPQGSAQGQTMKQESGTYAITKHMLHSELEPGRLRRVTAAVLVNDRMTMEGAGKMLHPVWKPRSQDEIRRMEELAQAAVGFDAKRGDQVVVENMSFNANVPEAPVSALNRAVEQAHGLLQTQPGLMRTLTMGVCGVLLVLFVLRPVARQITATLREPTLLKPGEKLPGQLGDGSGDWSASESAGQNELENPSARRAKSSAQMIFDGVSDHIRQQPQQSTRLLETWISAPDGNDAV
jgi:flagellar M-ring protein FliF